MTDCADVTSSSKNKINCFNYVKSPIRRGDTIPVQSSDDEAEDGSVTLSPNTKAIMATIKRLRGQLKKNKKGTDKPKVFGGGDDCPGCLCCQGW
jgi:hypothetical protein